jgi:hypothetical protein
MASRTTGRGNKGNSQFSQPPAGISPSFLFNNAVIDAVGAASGENKPVEQIDFLLASRCSEPNSWVEI